MVQMPNRTYDNGNKLREEPVLGTQERMRVSHGTAKDASENILPPSRTCRIVSESKIVTNVDRRRRTWFRTVRNGNGKVTNVVGDHSVCHVDAVCVVFTDLAFVGANPYTTGQPSE